MINCVDPEEYLCWDAEAWLNKSLEEMQTPEGIKGAQKHMRRLMSVIKAQRDENRLLRQCISALESRPINFSQ